jgi:hypothetical protein
MLRQLLEEPATTASLNGLPHVREPLTEEAEAELFGLLCDYWRLDWPDTPNDSMQHTSSVCREKGEATFRELGIW